MSHPCIFLRLRDGPYISVNLIFQLSTMAEANKPPVPEGAGDLEKQGLDGMVNALRNST